MDGIIFRGSGWGRDSDPTGFAPLRLPRLPGLRAYPGKSRLIPDGSHVLRPMDGASALGTVPGPSVAFIPAALRLW